MWRVALITLVLVVSQILPITIYNNLSTRPPLTPRLTGRAVIASLPSSSSPMGVFNRAAVVSVGAPCANIGRNMLLAGGSAVDAAIATLLCDGVYVMQSMGVGGGFIMTVYNRTERKAYSLVAKETAPAAATKDMFVDHPGRSTHGAMAVAVPGELKGYQEAHKKFGKLPWRNLFQPTIKLCEEGILVSKRMAESFREETQVIKASPTFLAVVLNSTGGRIPQEGERLNLPLLAQTLRIIADSPNMADELYKGSLTKQFVADIQAAGGIITEADMNNYKVRWEKPYNTTLSGGETVYSSALPGSGVLVTFMLRVLDGLLQFASSEVQRSQLIVETFKHAFGRRTNLGDPHFVNKTLLDEALAALTTQEAIMETKSKIKSNWTSTNVSYYGADYWADDHGTNNIVVVAPDGSAVTVTSSLNLDFGSKFVSSSTGILLNDQMDDFASPGIINYYGFRPSETNCIAPGKRPMSSMSPTIILDRKGDFRLGIGAIGGSRITTQILLVTIKNLWLGKNIKEAIDEPRFHHQLKPMNISYENGTPRELIEGWRSIGHTTERFGLTDFSSIVTGIARLGKKLSAYCDWRKPGAIAGF